MGRRAAAGVILAIGLVGGCASVPFAPPGLSCRAGERRAEVLYLYFGRNLGAELGVSDQDFRRFVDDEVTPRFPDGLTVLEANGQWRGQGGGLVREPTKVLQLVLSGRPGEAEKAHAVAEAYKARFSQEAVMILRTPVCVSF